MHFYTTHCFRGGSALIQTAADIFLHVHVQQQLKTWRTGPAIQVQFPSELIYVFCSLIRVSLATGLEKKYPDFRTIG